MNDMLMEWALELEKEKEYKKTLINLRDDIKNACECSLLSVSEKKQWYKEVEALEWAFGELGIEVK